MTKYQKLHFVTLCVLFFREMHVNSLCQSVVLLELVRPKGDPAHYSFSPHCTLFPSSQSQVPR